METKSTIAQPNVSPQHGMMRIHVDDGPRKVTSQLEHDRFAVLRGHWFPVLLAQKRLVEHAWIAGCAVLMPDMSHLRTYPSLYPPFETYIPLRWDLADLF